MFIVVVDVIVANVMSLSPLSLPRWRRYLTRLCSRVLSSFATPESSSSSPPPPVVVIAVVVVVAVVAVVDVVVAGSRARLSSFLHKVAEHLGTLGTLACARMACVQVAASVRARARAAFAPVWNECAG